MVLRQKRTGVLIIIFWILSSFNFESNCTCLTCIYISVIHLWINYSNNIVYTLTMQNQRGWRFHWCYQYHAKRCVEQKYLVQTLSLQEAGRSNLLKKKPNDILKFYWLHCLSGSVIWNLCKQCLNNVDTT